LLAERQQSFASAVCQEAEEADAHKAMRKHMQEEAAQGSGKTGEVIRNNAAMKKLAAQLQ
jgi:hypothetical protein